MSLFIFLLTGLSTSSFFLSDYLTKIMAKNEYSEAQLNFAIEHENLTALNQALKHTELHSTQWLTLARILAKTQGEAAFQLAIYYKKKPKKNIFWFKQASRLGFHQATLALAQHFFDQNDFVSAENALLAFPTNNLSITTKVHGKLQTKLLILKLNLAISQGQVGYIENSLRQDTQLLKETAVGQLLLKDIEKYQIGKLTNKALDANKKTQQCDNSIQLFATSLAHLKHVESLIEEFKTQPIHKAICFSPVRYLPINVLDCSQGQNTAIRCDELQWASFAQSINTRYVGVMLPKGGANVHLGMLYFDSHDTADVVAHEISHLLGFIDEYPLKAEHITCQSPQTEIFAHNIAVIRNQYQGDQQAIRAQILKQLSWGKHIKQSTPILHAVTDSKGNPYWQLGTPENFKHEIGVFKAQTCNDTRAKKMDKVSAYKALAQRTPLQYFSLDFPPLYMLLLNENSTSYRMPSFQYNIALAYFQQTSLTQGIAKLPPSQQAILDKKNIRQANYWLEQAAKWEHDRERHKKIRKGGF